MGRRASSDSAPCSGHAGPRSARVAVRGPGAAGAEAGGLPAAAAMMALGVTSHASDRKFLKLAVRTLRVLRDRAVGARGVWHQKHKKSLNKKS
jgi:hypothetical protein